MSIIIRCGQCNLPVGQVKHETMMARDLLACQKIRFSSLFAAGDVLRGGMSATQWQKFYTDDINLSEMRSEALIGRRSSYIVLAIVYE